MVSRLKSNVVERIAVTAINHYNQSQWTALSKSKSTKLPLYHEENGLVFVTPRMQLYSLGVFFLHRGLWLKFPLNPPPAVINST